MNVRARLAGLTMIIVVLCTLGYSLVGTGIMWPLLGLVCVGVHLLIHGIGGRDNYMLPKWIVVIAAFGVLTWGVTRAMSGNKIDALCESVLALMFVKIWDRKVPADYAQILTLAVYLAIGCTVSGDFGPVVVTSLIVPILLAGTMLFQIYAGQHRFVRHGSRASQLRWSNATFAAFFASGFVLIAGVTSLMFVLMPRGPMLESAMLRSSWVARLGGVAHVSGFSEQVELGRAGLISPSRAVVAEVAVLPSEDGTQRSVEVVHLRGAVLEKYENGRWEPGITNNLQRENDSLDLKRGQSVTPGGRPNSAAAARELRLRVTMQDVDRQVPAFAPWWPAAIEFASEGRLRVDRHTLLLKRAGQEGSFSYTVTSFIGASADPVVAEARLPSQRPKVDFADAVVKSYTRDLLKRSNIEQDPSIRLPAEDGRVARAIEAHLRREFKYTLQMLAAPEGQDPIAWFLTTSKQGHCEYFASAMVAMCRSVGIPARLITGYVAAETSNQGMFVVRESNAHAWVEAAVDGFPPDVTYEGTKDAATWHSWRTFDPTPPSDFTRIHQPEPSVSLRIGRFLSSLESSWASSILRFDDRSQRDMLASRGISTNWLETKLTQLSMLLGGEEDSVKARTMRWGGFAVAFVVGGSLLGWLVNLLIARRRAQRRLTAHEQSIIKVRPELAALRDQYNEVLAKSNLARAPCEPLLKHFERVHSRLATIHPNLPVDIEVFISLLYLGQFGAGLNQSQLLVANEKYANIKRLLTSEK